MSNLRLLLALCLGISVPWAWAQNYPTKPVRLIVGVAPGGEHDAIARVVATEVTQTLGQQVVVDNRPGAGGSIAAALTAHAAPDGYTLMTVSTNVTIYPFMYRAPYDTVRDFAPVTQLISQPYLLTINSAVPAATLSELIALARKQPGTISYGSAGSGSLQHLAGELFKFMTRTNLVHIPYKGGAPAMIDLIAGQIQLLFPAIATAIPNIKSGRVRGLAVTTRTRSMALPDLPTMDEAGVPGFDVTWWVGMLAPVRTPRPVIDRLQREIAAALQRPELIARLAVTGNVPVVSSPEQFGQYIRSEIDKWGKVIKQAGIGGD